MKHPDKGRPMENGMKNRDDDTTLMSIKSILAHLPGVELSAKIQEELCVGDEIVIGTTVLRVLRK